MKSKMKGLGTTELPRFVVGALATAGASVANGATVQITFDNNIISSTGSGLVSSMMDVTGDDLGDVMYFAFSRGVQLKGMGPLTGGDSSSTSTAKWRAWAGLGGTNFIANVGELAMMMPMNVGPAMQRGVMKVTFSDARMNQAAQTLGWLDITAKAGPSGHSFEINRLIFDDASPIAPLGVTAGDAAYTEWSAVPEPSSLALLALGAGGLLARRRRAA